MTPSTAAEALTNSEKSALGVFRQVRVAVGEMLCFYGPDYKKHRPALRQLVDKEFLVAERFTGAYSLTAAGFAVMRAFK